MLHAYPGHVLQHVQDRVRGGLPARDEPPLKPAQFTAIPAAGEESARAFLKRVDAQVGELMFG